MPTAPRRSTTVTARPAAPQPIVDNENDDEVAIPDDIAADSIESTDTEVEDDFDDLSDDELSNIIDQFGIEFEIEDRPKSEGRAGRPKAKTVPWELVLSTLKTDYPGQDMRILKPFSGDKAEARARGKARDIRLRLFTASPNDLWSVSHRRDPETGEWKVFGKFERLLTKQEAADRIAKRQQVAERMAEGRAATKAAAESKSDPAADSQ